MENLGIILLKSRQVFTSSSFSHSILNTDLVHGARIFIFPSVDLVSSTSLEASWWQTLFYTLYSGIEVDLKLYWFLLTYPFLNNFQAFLSKSHPLIVGLPASSPPFFFLHTLCIVISWAFGSNTSCMFRPTWHAEQVDSPSRENTLVQKKAGIHWRYQNSLLWPLVGPILVGGEWGPKSAKFKGVLTQDCEVAHPALVWLRESPGLDL